MSVTLIICVKYLYTTYWKSATIGLAIIVKMGYLNAPIIIKIKLRFAATVFHNPAACAWSILGQWASGCKTVVASRLKVGLYFRRRQALWHAFIRVLRRICLYFSRRHQRRQRARESAARRKMLQSSTVLNFHALRQRTQAIQPIIYRCHELSLQRIDLAITS